MMEKNYVDLLALLTLVKRSIVTAFPNRIWVKGEISSFSHKPYSHAYLGLSQTEDGSIVANVRANIWKTEWDRIDQHFRSVTHSSLGVGMEILACVQVSYSPIYGLSLTVNDIDPEFTLGANERQKRETIDRLTREGLMERQNRLELPVLPYRLAVISAKTAAGYGDFCHHLIDNVYGFKFDVQLFEAAMQGEGAPASICSAINAIVSGNKHYDAVLILRGGGSELDLACFDDYDIASAIAHCPIPVITAIGHDRDYHVADMVAKIHVKTPTALADLFLDCFISEDQHLNSLESRLILAFGNRIASMEQRLDVLASRIRQSSSSRILKAEKTVELFSVNISSKVESRLQGQQHLLDRYNDRIGYAFGAKFDRALMALDRTEQKIRTRADSAVSQALSSLMVTEQKIRLKAESSISDAFSHLMRVETRIETTDPRNILRKGFVLALDRSGVKMSSASQSHIGDRVQMMFADGTLKCGVVEIDRRSNVSDDEEPEALSKNA